MSLDSTRNKKSVGVDPDRKERKKEVTAAAPAPRPPTPAPPKPTAPLTPVPEKENKPSSRRDFGVINPEVGIAAFYNACNDVWKDLYESYRFYMDPDPAALKLTRSKLEVINGKPTFVWSLVTNVAAGEPWDVYWSFEQQAIPFIRSETEGQLVVTLRSAESPITIDEEILLKLKEAQVRVEQIKPTRKEQLAKEEEQKRKQAAEAQQKERQEQEIKLHEKKIAIEEWVEPVPWELSEYKEKQVVLARGFTEQDIDRPLTKPGAKVVVRQDEEKETKEPEEAGQAAADPVPSPEQRARDNQEGARIFASQNIYQKILFFYNQILETFEPLTVVDKGQVTPTVYAINDVPYEFQNNYSAIPKNGVMVHVYVAHLFSPTEPLNIRFSQNKAYIQVKEQDQFSFLGQIVRDAQGQYNFKQTLLHHEESDYRSAKIISKTVNLFLQKISQHFSSSVNNKAVAPPPAPSIIPHKPKSIAFPTTVTRPAVAAIPPPPPRKANVPVRRPAAIQTRPAVPPPARADPIFG